jgi:hypothetical protein
MPASGPVTLVNQLIQHHWKRLVEIPLNFTQVRDDINRNGFEDTMY